MANMSYCRWHNTLNDLRDCAHVMNEGDHNVSADEQEAARNLFDLMKEMLQAAGCTVEEPEDGFDLSCLNSDDEDSKEEINR